MYGFEHIKTSLDVKPKRRKPVTAGSFFQEPFMRGKIIEVDFVDNNSSPAKSLNTYEQDKTFYYIEDSYSTRDSRDSKQRAESKLQQLLNKKNNGIL